MAVGRVIKRSNNSILLTLIIALYLQRAFSCESKTTTLDWCKSNLNTDGFLNDFGEGKRSICEFNERHLGYAGGKTNWNSMELFIKLARQRTKYMKRRVKYSPNSVAQFNILLLAGDVETNPGDVKNPCSVVLDQ